MTTNNKLKTFLVLNIVLMAFTSASSYAETKNKYENIYNDCLDKEKNINNSIVAICSEAASEAAKKEMNRLYDKIYEEISEQSKEDAQKFEDSQKAWLKYRNTRCDLMGSYFGSPMYSYCPMQLNIAQALELQELARE